MNMRVPVIAALVVMGMQAGVFADNRPHREGSSAVIASNGDDLFWRIKLCFDNTRDRECVRPPEPARHVNVCPPKPPPRQVCPCCSHPGKAKGWHKRHVCQHQHARGHQNWAWRH